MNSPSQHAVRVRVVGWAVYGILLATTAFLLTMGAPAVLAARISDALLYLAPAALTLGGAVLLSARTQGEERRLWRLIAVISALILCAETYFTWYITTVSFAGPDMPAFYQLFQLTAVALGVWVVMTLTAFGSSPVRSILRFCFDVLGATIVLGAACYWLFVLPLYRPVPGVTWEAAAVSSLYPVVGLTIVGFMAAAAAGGRTYRWRSWERLIALSFLLYGAALIATPFAYVQMKSDPEPSGPLWATAALGFAVYVLFMAIVYRLTAPARDTGVEAWFFPRLGPKWLPMTYPIVLAAALPGLGAAAFRIGRNPEGVPITVAAMGLAAVLVVRSWLGSSETVLHRELAMRDSVSGAYNYRYLQQRLESDLEYARVAGTQVAVVTIAVEGLRTIHDVDGAAAQDAALRSLAEAINAEADGTDSSLCRSASDAFVLIARGSGSSDAVTLTRRLLQAAAGSVEQLGVRMGFSAGIAVYPGNGHDVDALIARSSSAQTVAAAHEDMSVVVYDETHETSPGLTSSLVVARMRSRRATTRALAAAVNARNPETRRHSENVADLASALALVMDLSPERSQVLDLAAQMHDVGMIGVPDSVLTSIGTLSAPERELAEQHAILGERILASARLDEIAPTVRHHHERWDGTGYPDGLAGTAIPLEARILAVCDAYESMTSPHGEYGGHSVEEAVEEIKRCAGSQFDPEVAATFGRMIMQIHSASPRDHAGRSGAPSRRQGTR